MHLAQPGDGPPPVLPPDAVAPVHEFCEVSDLQPVSLWQPMEIGKKMGKDSKKMVMDIS